MYMHTLVGWGRRGAFDLSVRVWRGRARRRCSAHASISSGESVFVAHVYMYESEARDCRRCNMREKEGLQADGDYVMISRGRRLFDT